MACSQLIASSTQQKQHSWKSLTMSIWGLDQHQSTLLVALDQSAAFDCIDHSTVIRRLEHLTGWPRILATGPSTSAGATHHPVSYTSTLVSLKNRPLDLCVSVCMLLCCHVCSIPSASDTTSMLTTHKFTSRHPSQICQTVPPSAKNAFVLTGFSVAPSDFCS